MKDKQCELTRRELEELMLNDEFSTTTTAHLQSCSDCREFQQQQTKLRQIVGSLGTVNAPADFDFRLRARLVADSHGANFRYWSFAMKGLATAAVLGVFAVGAFMVWQGAHRQENNTKVAATAPTPAPVPGIEPGAVNPTQPSDVARRNVTVANNNNPPVRRTERSLQGNFKPKRSLVAVDFSSQRAPVERKTNLSVVAVFPIETSLQSLRVSLDDGRGNARTISFPAVSFGSQRVPATANQFTAKNNW